MPTATEPLWPAEFIGPDLSPDHCRDVLEGSYDVPFNPKTPPKILDIGANVGAFARWADKRWPGAEIMCYEPHPGNFAMLEKTRAGMPNPDGRVLLYNQAVLNKQGRMPLVAGQFNCGEHSLCWEKKEDSKFVEVDVMDAKDLPRADILKLDVEGAEAAILESLDKAGRLPGFSAIMLEYHADVIGAGVSALMKERGFLEVGRKEISQHRGELKFMRKDCIDSLAEVNFALPTLTLKAPKKPDERVPESHFLMIIAHDGNITSNTVDAIMQIQHTKKAWAGWKFDMSGGQVLSRNRCLNAFIQQTPCSHALFVDGDIVPREPHVMALRRHPEAAESIICGVYCKKVNRIEHVYNSIKGGNPEPNKLGLMEVAKGATGFMQIPRVALDKIRAAFPERAYKCDYDFQPDGSRADKYSYCFHDIRMDQEYGFMRDQSEDWAFCELARSAGVKIYADVSTTTWLTTNTPPIMHRGPILFPLQVELERLQAVETLETERKKYETEIAELNGQIQSLLKHVKIA